MRKRREPPEPTHELETRSRTLKRQRLECKRQETKVAPIEADFADGCVVAALRMAMCWVNGADRSHSQGEIAKAIQHGYEGDRGNSCSSAALYLHKQGVSFKWLSGTCPVAESARDLRTTRYKRAKSLARSTPFVRISTRDMAQARECVKLDLWDGSHDESEDLSDIMEHLASGGIALVIVDEKTAEMGAPECHMMVLTGMNRARTAFLTGETVKERQRIPVRQFTKMRSPGDDVLLIFR